MIGKRGNKLSEEPDKKLGDPNKNPWYVLATIFGEQPVGAHSANFDRELAIKNRRAWNGWFCGNLSDVERLERAKLAKLNSEELAPLTEKELTEIQNLFIQRTITVRVGNLKLPTQTENFDFSGLNFSKFIDFSNMIFENNCVFDFSIFHSGANFSASNFRTFVDFNFITFKGRANFHSTTFRASTSVIATKFILEANFSHCSFKSRASFSSASFNDFTEFYSVSFDENAFFLSCKFNEDVSFVLSTFNNDIFFNSAKFNATTLFSGVRFLTKVPNFYNTKFFDDTIFSLPDDFTRNWPPISGTVEIDGQDKPVEVMPAAEQKRAYNRLRLFMSKSLQIDEEQYFHRMEMRCKAQTQSWPYRLLFSAYEAISDYGNSIWRPIGWLTIVWLAGACARLATIKAENIQSELPLALGAAFHSLGWSFANIFSFFGFQRRYFAGEELNWALNLLSATQTIFGFILLFLLGLGLRNRFRLR